MEAFDIALNFAGDAHSPAQKRIIKIFTKGLNDQKFELGIIRQDPRTLEECYTIAEEVRAQLAQYVSTALALDMDHSTSDRKNNTV
jgi:hypothetical protein